MSAWSKVVGFQLWCWRQILLGRKKFGRFPSNPLGVPSIRGVAGLRWPLLQFLTQHWVATGLNQKPARLAVFSIRAGRPCPFVRRTFGLQKKRPDHSGRFSFSSSESLGVWDAAIGQACFFRCISTLNPHVLLSAIGQCHLKLLRCPGPRSLAWVVCASQMWGERCR